MPRINRALPFDMIDAKKEIFKPFCDNFMAYLNIVTEYRYSKFCKLNKYTNHMQAMRAYISGKKGHSDLLAVAIHMAFVSKLPIGTWLFGDIRYLYEHGIILGTDECDFSIGINYLTDGVYFYSKHIGHAVPLGANPQFQRMIDDCFDLRIWKYQQPSYK